LGLEKRRRPEGERTEEDEVFVFHGELDYAPTIALLCNARVCTEPEIC
jgi:hypothetical protein